MTDEPNATGEPQAGEPAQINPQPQAGIPPTDPQAGESQKPTLSAADYERMIADLRKENAGHRTKLKKFEDDEKTRADAQLTEQQKRERQLSDYQSQNADLVRQLQELRINNAVQVHASRLGFADPSDAVRFLDPSELEFDDGGTPTNVEPLLKAVLKSKPYLGGKSATPVTAGGATSPARSATGAPQTLTKEYVQQIQRGGPQAWNALSLEEQQRISAFIRAGGLFKR